MTKSILIIGSGAVGAVYAQAITKAGGNAAFLVRNPDSPNCTMPRTLYRYKLRGGYQEEQQQLDTFGQMEDAKTQQWDQIWLCTPSDALSSDWLQQQIAAIDPATPLIAWTPDITDIDKLRQLHQGAICQGLIGLISFQSPLPGQNEPPPGIAYVPLPGAATLNDDEHGREVCQLLKTGGIPANTRKDLPWWEARAAGVNICLMAALEQEDWSLVRLRRSPKLDLAIRAADEAVEGSAAYLGVSSKLFHYTPIGLIVRTIMVLGPKLSPIPLETYLQYHFSKVGNQTRQIISSWQDYCKASNLPYSNLQALRDGLDAQA